MPGEPAASTEPALPAGPTASAEPTASPGGSAFGSWYSAAGVRGGARQFFGPEMERGRVFFPAELVPHLSHEAVRALPPARVRELTVRHLYQFLLSATHLETRVVNRGAERIAANQAGVDLPTAGRLDAYKIYCDEGYHSLYSLDLADQIAIATGIPIPGCDYGAFVGELARTGRDLLPGEPVLAQLLQVIVFETLITAVLNEVPNDPTVVTAVRELTRDHARDEGRHHRFFTGFFHVLWAQLSGSLRIRVGAAVPGLVLACLAVDVGPIRVSLRLAGLDGAAADAVVRDVYGGAAATRRSRELARATVQMCESAGVLDLPGAREHFATHGLG
ncbi:diiron oxygenase [Parafrankia discariae]|uniref:diiron oxygenase n=1 Tax=Parafrankia discariae TaxID=365528 RepID=UPI0003A4DB6A|nr:diiron oxygenase [Parafrankia discariae]